MTHFYYYFTAIKHIYEHCKYGYLKPINLLLLSVIFTSYSSLFSSFLSRFGVQGYSSLAAYGLPSLMSHPFILSIFLLFIFPASITFFCTVVSALLAMCSTTSSVHYCFWRMLLPMLSFLFISHFILPAMILRTFSFTAIIWLLYLFFIFILLYSRKNKIGDEQE